MNINDIGGTVIKDNDTYLLKDNATLKNLIVSSTKLHALKSTPSEYTPVEGFR